jgi:hypothetical protein
MRFAPGAAGQGRPARAGNGGSTVFAAVVLGIEVTPSVPRSSASFDPLLGGFPACRRCQQTAYQYRFHAKYYLITLIIYLKYWNLARAARVNLQYCAKYCAN